MNNDVKKLLDNGWCVCIFRNGLDSYTAFATGQEDAVALCEDLEERLITDDFEPSIALYRLTEKVTTGKIKKN